MLQIIEMAGDFVSDDVWFRVVQIVTNNEDLQAYAAKKCFDALSNRETPAHEKMVRLGAYVLGEFGATIDEEEG